ncbi:2-succinyl-5-enolpyruvyl-6-hydroxy-3-cyclohexene-1-carboxylate synthase [Croceivirga lutea]|uniref:2-succinyl-5-enolpyruvyl-6-hydroxy-3- cyclohexene-1-carboxylic-acid synthase n=1 Tax=Croceivirga lutea TaxID=1775167 RepID=UPI001639FC1C|nr:2-succinyl-5-enolpyruvyl-6-hydroxy-3-cyclohexene-1-carboxylic-acid synthase [Croceivirga lutea]GGG43708.1 2-succinyl-5-enolpyruvyl-6-hydroxy-3-cyclohexene-1-carboxylate synthase [Croceivirga lutea]
MKYSTIPTAKNLVQLFKLKGIKDIIISPGSRNAPLILSFTADPFFNCFSIVDERSAAFFATGIAQNQRRPAAVLCSSGSALLNYYPAVAEAFYSELPLIVISADRPPYKIDIGDGQTIRQDNVFYRHIGYSANLKLDVSHAYNTIAQFSPELLAESQDEIDRFNKNQILEALGTACSKSLPVHINIPFEEPLYNTIDDDSPILDTAIVTDSIHLDVSEIEDYKAIWNTASKKLVLVGVSHPNEINVEVLNSLIADPSVLVFTETTSNLNHHEVISSIDSVIFPIEKSTNSEHRFKELQPEILLTFGGLVVSKKVKAFLRKYKPKHHWHVDITRAFDTYFSLTKHFKCPPQEFLDAMLTNYSYVSSDYNPKWKKVKENYLKKQQEYLQQIPFSDFLAFDLIFKAIPNNYQMHLSNSSTVRYAQLFPIKSNLKVYCNRGTSGIDGSTSTAVGAAFYEKKPTLLISGDLSFFYDSNALWNSYVKKNFRIILINNSGGGIFRILPGNDGSETFEKYFETKQNTNVEHLCLQFGVEYYAAKTKVELENNLSGFFKNSDATRLLEVFTPREVNNKILLGYFDFIS